MGIFSKTVQESTVNVAIITRVFEGSDDLKIQGAKITCFYLLFFIFSNECQLTDQC